MCRQSELDEMKLPEEAVRHRYPFQSTRVIGEFDVLPFEVGMLKNHRIALHFSLNHYGYLDMPRATISGLGGDEETSTRALRVNGRFLSQVGTERFNAWFTLENRLQMNEKRGSKSYHKVLESRLDALEQKHLVSRFLGLFLFAHLNVSQWDLHIAALPWMLLKELFAASCMWILRVCLSSWLNLFVVHG